MLVILSFKSAKLVFPYKTKYDGIYDLDAAISGVSLKSRKEIQHCSLFDERFAKQPFEFEHISNMLHVLMGARPVPTLHRTIRKRVEIIDEIAKTAWFKIHNIYYDKKADGSISYRTSFTQGRKLYQNSNRKTLKTIDSYGNVYVGINATWNTLRKKYYYYNIDRYNRILNKFTELYGSDDYMSKYSLVDLIRYLSDEMNYAEELKIFFTNERIKPLCDIIDKKEKCEDFNKSGKNGSNDNWNLAKRIENTHIIYTVTLNGEIVVDIPDELYVDNDEAFYRFRNNCASLLEGGVVTVEEIDYFADAQSYGKLNGFTKLEINNWN